MAAAVVPSESELKAALVSLRAENATLGTTKIHALLLATHPTWTVSEKRTRKALQAEGLMVGHVPQGAPNKTEQKVYPESHVIEGLDVGKWTNKVEVRYFGKIKGKGLVAKDNIKQGEVVWKEDPFVVAPEWDIFDLQQCSPSRACALCTTPFGDSPLITPCPASTRCPARFCNRLCLSRSAGTHPLLCPGQNPASAALIAFARRHEWMALHALALCAARVLLAGQRDDVPMGGGGAFSADMGVLRAFATLGMEERVKEGSFGDVEPDRATWKEAYRLFLCAFCEPSTPQEKKRLARILKKPTAESVSREFFEYDAFLRGLGRMSLNMEAHGGLYVLHSHLNHDCAPNVSVRHLDQRTALSRITVIARRDIHVGEELLVTYVDPALGVRERRRALRAWDFGLCRCGKCVEEEEKGDAVPAEGGDGMGDLEWELKAGLGLS